MRMRHLGTPLSVMHKGAVMHEDGAALCVVDDGTCTRPSLRLQCWVHTRCGLRETAPSAPQQPAQSARPRRAAASPSQSCGRAWNASIRASPPSPRRRHARNLRDRVEQLLLFLGCDPAVRQDARDALIEKIVRPRARTFAIALEPVEQELRLRLHDSAIGQHAVADADELVDLSIREPMLAGETPGVVVAIGALRVDE